MDMTFTEREAEVRLTRIEAARALGSEASPWAREITWQLADFVAGETFSRAQTNRLDIDSSSLCNQLEEDVRTMDEYGRYAGLGGDASPREVASWYHNGQGSAYYSYCSAGHISPRLVDEISADLTDPSFSGVDELRSILEAIVCDEQ